MKLSKFGTKFTSQSGILQLMDDLGKALAGGDKLSLGGGNPAHIPEMEQIWRRQMEKLMKDGRKFESMLGNYTTPQGDVAFMEAMVKFININYKWGISQKNIAVIGGSQTSFYFLFNMLAGKMEDGSFKKILFPIVPEYIGYADQGNEADMFVGMKPTITHIDKHTYKYGIDFDKLKITDEIAAIAISRPTNPTGNVITDEETKKLAKLATEKGIPFILDNAYGLPFPNIVFTEANPIYEGNMIYVMTLSKIGLPSTRTSIVIANEDVIKALSALNAIISLSTGTIGQYLMTELIESGEVMDLAKNIIHPFYAKKSQEAVAVLHKNLRDDIPWHLHKSEGALFLWLWCENMPITSMELYERLKERGVIVVPGEYFFPGFDEEWQHRRECIRISYSMKDEVVYKGLEIIADEVNKVYS